MTLVPCLRCSTPAPPALESCPCCGAALEEATLTMRPAVMLAVSLAFADGVGNGQPSYGVAIPPDTRRIDNDADGYTEVGGDCDDSNPDIHPEAVETPGDGIDANCDGEDDT